MNEIKNNDDTVYYKNYKKLLIDLYTDDFLNNPLEDATG